MFQDSPEDQTHGDGIEICSRCRLPTLQGQNLPIVVDAKTGGYLCVDCRKPSNNHKDNLADWEEEIRMGAPWTQDGKLMLEKFHSLLSQARKEERERIIDDLIAEFDGDPDSRVDRGTLISTLEDIKAKKYA